ncbi:hypothetical protein [Calothrix sp. UHCC 0171]|nr:hypothetical protein [Calothrix sp. UHCC 0171]MEA5570915.1 hypothetical protein [Calothrix sp. UHCC 0171]
MAAVILVSLLPLFLVIFTASDWYGEIGHWYFLLCPDIIFP